MSVAMRTVGMRHGWAAALVWVASVTGPGTASAQEGATPADADPTATVLARRYGTLMQERSLKVHAKTGWLYPTSYGDSLYDWELYFDGLALAYYGITEPAQNGIRLFVDSQREDGFICRRIHRETTVPPDDDWRRIQEYEAEELCKPFLCQLALVLSRLRGDATWLGRENLDKLARYLDHWLTAWDLDGNGLSEWNSGPHSGADTQLERVGPWRSRFDEGIDLNCYLYQECLAAAELAVALQDSALAARFRQEAARKRSRLLERWNEEDGLFYDRDRRTGAAIKVKSAAAFLPLWAGVATARQAASLVERHLKNEQGFWTPCPIPSYARCEPSYTQRYVPPPGASVVEFLTPGHANWCGGMWPHWNYLIIHGLQDYGYEYEAREIAARWFRAASHDRGLFEWYNAETGEGEGVNPFWAGSSVLGVLLPTELEMRINPTAVAPVTEPLRLDAVRSRLRLVSP